MIYSDVETHRASLRERINVFRLVWAVAGDACWDLPLCSRAEQREHIAQRRAVRRLAIRQYWLRLHPEVSTYVVNRRG